MPEDPTIKEILTATNIHYFSCKAILEVLLETEKGTKNILGMYTSQRISGLYLLFTIEYTHIRHAYVCWTPYYILYVAPKMHPCPKVENFVVHNRADL